MCKEQYDNVCNRRFTRVEQSVAKIDDKTDEIHAIVTNGLRDRVSDLIKHVEILDRRLWVMLGTITFGMLATIALQLILR